MKGTKTTITILILILALFQGPLLYYYGNGFGVFITMFPYMLIGSVLSIILMVKLQRISTNTKFNIIGAMIGISLGIATLFSEDLVGEIDWTLRQSQRNEIVNQVRQGTLGSKSQNSFVSLSGRYFPPISNGGNNILIERNEDKTLSVSFFINTGFLDHYSAIMYTNSSSEIALLNDTINKRKTPGFKKFDENWYRVSW